MTSTMISASHGHWTPFSQPAPVAVPIWLSFWLRKNAKPPHSEASNTE